MSARAIGEIIPGIIARAELMAVRQRIVASVEHPSRAKAVIVGWWERGIVTADEAELLIEHNGLEAA